MNILCRYQQFLQSGFGSGQRECPLICFKVLTMFLPWVRSALSCAYIHSEAGPASWALLGWGQFLGWGLRARGTSWSHPCRWPLATARWTLTTNQFILYIHTFGPLHLCFARYDFSHWRQAQMGDCWKRLDWINIDDILKDTCMAIRLILLAHEQNNELMRRTKTSSRKSSCFCSTATSAPDGFQQEDTQQ